MAPLVEKRTMGSYPFEFVGVDLAGPFLCQQGVRRAHIERWIEYGCG